jgi:DNA-binding NtrC family response regulator
MILLVGDKLVHFSPRRVLEALGHQCMWVESFTEAARCLSRTSFELVLLSLDLADGGGLALLRRLRFESPDTRVVAIAGSSETAIEAMRLGAFDFVRRPFDLLEPLTSARNALHMVRLERRAAYLARCDPPYVLACASPAMRKVDDAILGATRQPVVLIVGEIGTGKSLVARRIHHASRADGPFVEMQCRAHTQKVLFGHEADDQVGLIEVADGGTLFLDDVGALDAAAQAGLFAFLSSSEARRLGGTACRRVDVRLIAATKRPLDGDLHRRLSAFSIALPPLRERREDIVPLAEHFLQRDAQRFRRGPRNLSEAAGAILEAWHWPGNVGELKVVIQRTALACPGESVEPEHLPADLSSRSDPTTELPTLEELQRRYVRAVLDLSGGNKLRAAEKLGISRQTLAAKLDDAE